MRQLSSRFDTHFRASRRNGPPIQFAMPSFCPAILGLFLAAAIGSAYANYFVTPSTAVPTTGGSSITISGTWYPEKWSPVVSLQGMAISSSNWFMSRTSLTLKVPAGPGCNDSSSSLHVISLCEGSSSECSGEVINRTINVFSLRFSYDPPFISSVEPQPANFGDSLSVTIFGRNFGKQGCNLPSVTVITMLASRVLQPMNLCVCRLGRR